MNFLFLAFAVGPIVVVLLSNEQYIRPTICGVTAALTASFVETYIIAYLGSRGVGTTNFVFALTEEMLKFALLSTTSIRSGPSNRALVAGALCGLAFGCTENFGYTIGFWQNSVETSQAIMFSIMRFLLPLAMHVTAGPILTVCLLRKDWAPMIGLVAATLYHWGYNSGLTSQTPVGFTLSILMIFGGFIASSLIYKITTVRDVQQW